MMTLANTRTTAQEMTFIRVGSAGSNSVVPDPFPDPFDAPFTLPTRPLAAHCSGGPRPNWDGTPAHSSGARGRRVGQPLGDPWRQPGGVS